MDKSTGPATEAVWQWKPGVSDISVSEHDNDFSVFKITTPQSNRAPLAPSARSTNL